MNDDPDRLVIRTELWLQWAADHGVRYDDADKSIDDVARDYYQTRDASRELLAPDLMGGTLTASHQMAANTAYARVLLIEAAIERRGGDLDLSVDPIQVNDPNGRIVPRRLTPEPGARWESVAATVAAPEQLPQLHDIPTTTSGFRP